MNIERQYKLYRLGIELPPTIGDAFRFVEDIFTKLSILKSKNAKSVLYIDANDNNKVYMENPKNGEIWCRNTGFWKVLIDKYLFYYDDAEKMIMLMVAYHFKLKNLTPVNLSDVIACRYWT